ncbi:MAG: transposase [Pseudomonadota bacterium]
MPDETTIWRFREALVQAGAVERLFARFDAHLREAGYLAPLSDSSAIARRAVMGWQIVDASIIAAPCQCMTDEEKAFVKGGGIPDAWCATPTRLAQKDRDARWTLKRWRRKNRPDGSAILEIATPVFGYKSHINADLRQNAPRAPLRDVVRRWSVTDAARRDGRELGGLLDRENTGSAVWADTAYRSQKNEKKIARAGLASKIHFRRPPGKSMPAHRGRANAARSKVRSAVEHPFAEMEARMGLFVRTIGIDRAKGKIGIANLAYNMKRFVFWERRATVA